MTLALLSPFTRTVWGHETPKNGFWQGHESSFSDYATSYGLNLYHKCTNPLSMEQTRRGSITFKAALGRSLALNPPDSLPTPLEECYIPGK
jgi:hypothetical protein